MPEFYGKYRGKVAGNRDPSRLGRIQVEVPEVLGSGRTSWAMPCVPYAGKQLGWYAMPPVGASVWVEFEAGNPDFPIWSGCFWGPGELPTAAAGPEQIVLKAEGVTLTISDQEPARGFTVEVGAPVAEQPLKLALDGKTITLSLADLALTISAQDIQLSGGSTTLKLQSSGIDLSSNPAAVKLSSSGVELGSSPAAIKVSAQNIELSNGAANVKLSPASVNINNGALEVV